jgi:hypothetical protein
VSGHPGEPTRRRPEPPPPSEPEDAAGRDSSLPPSKQPVGALPAIVGALVDRVTALVRRRRT